jgi:hypothetical protein
MLIKEKNYWVLGIIALIAIVFINGCIQSQTNNTNNKTTDTGFLEGKVVIGPLCPMETVPPSSNCQPTEKTFKEYPIAVYTVEKKTKIAQINPNLDGTYSLELPVGTYIVDLEKGHMFEKNLPATVTIEEGKTTTLNINIDTGIR